VGGCKVCLPVVRLRYAYTQYESYLTATLTSSSSNPCKEEVGRGEGERERERLDDYYTKITGMHREIRRALAGGGGEDSCFLSRSAFRACTSVRPRSPPFFLSCSPFFVSFHFSTSLSFSLACHQHTLPCDIACLRILKEKHHLHSIVRPPPFHATTPRPLQCPQPSPPSFTASHTPYRSSSYYSHIQTDRQTDRPP
jgi:hypothetical protein